MSPERDDEMPAEFDMRGGVRGKYVERYRRWVSKHSITAATGTVEVRTVTSSGETGSVTIAPPHPRVIQDTVPALQERRGVIAPEESAVAAHAV